MGVRTAPGATLFTRIRHDVAAFELGNGLPCAQKLTGKVHADDPVPLLDGHLLERGVLLHARVVHEEVERPELSGYFGEHPLHLGLVGNIGLYRHTAAPEPLDVAHDLPCLLGCAAIVHRHVGTRFRERHGAGPSYARAGSGDEGSLAREETARPAAGFRGACGSVRHVVLLESFIYKFPAR
jgi:hypothetical protein